VARIKAALYNNIILYAPAVVALFGCIFLARPRWQWRSSNGTATIIYYIAMVYCIIPHYNILYIKWKIVFRVNTRGKVILVSHIELKTLLPRVTAKHTIVIGYFIIGKCMSPNASVSGFPLQFLVVVLERFFIIFFL